MSTGREGVRIDGSFCRFTMSDHFVVSEVIVGDLFTYRSRIDWIVRTISPSPSLN